MNGLLSLLGAGASANATACTEGSSSESAAGEDFAGLFSQVLGEPGKQTASTEAETSAEGEAEAAGIEGPDNPDAIMDALFELAPSHLRAALSSHGAQTALGGDAEGESVDEALPVIAGGETAEDSELMETLLASVDQLDAEGGTETPPAEAPVADGPSDETSLGSEVTPTPVAQGGDQDTTDGSTPVASGQTHDTDSDAESEETAETAESITDAVLDAETTPAEAIAATGAWSADEAPAGAPNDEDAAITAILAATAAAAAETSTPASVTSAPATVQSPAVQTVVAPAPTTAPAPPTSLPQPLSAQLAGPVHQMLSSGRDGTKTMTLNVASENVGPVTVKASFTTTGVRIELFTIQDAGRDALRSMLGDLRRDLAGLGLSVGNSSLSVSSAEPPSSSTQNQARGFDANSGDPAEHQRQRQAMAQARESGANTGGASPPQHAGFAQPQTIGAGLDLFA